MLPKFKMPISNSTQPARKQSNTIYSSGRCPVYEKVNIVIKLLGPIDICLMVPKNI